MLSDAVFLKQHSETLKYIKQLLWLPQSQTYWIRYSAAPESQSLAGILKFKHSLQDSLNPMCNCGRYVERISYFSLHCTMFATGGQTLLIAAKYIYQILLGNTTSFLTNICDQAHIKRERESNT